MPVSTPYTDKPGPRHDPSTTLIHRRFRSQMVLRSGDGIRGLDASDRTKPNHAVMHIHEWTWLDATPDRILNDLKLMGFLFESLVVRDLRVYAQANDASVFHYRDNTGLEVDAIVETTDGKWVAFEIKLGHGYIDDAATNLNKFAKRVYMESNTSLSVIVSTGLGYTREDCISIIPIGSLGP